MLVLDISREALINKALQRILLRLNKLSLTITILKILDLFVPLFFRSEVRCQLIGCKNQVLRFRSLPSNVKRC